MKNKLTFYSLFLLSFLVPFFSFGQEQSEAIPMADKFREEGKIYVVVAVVAIILVGIFVTLFYLERRIKKLEQKA